MTASSNSKEPKGRKPPVPQSDIPSMTLKKALKVAEAISDNYAKKPTKPLRVAEALGVSPTTGGFRMLASASAAYGLTEGSAWANEISLLPLGRRCVAPTVEGDDIIARREAALMPRIAGEFLQRYDGSKFPAEKIALNVLEEMGLPASGAPKALEVIAQNAKDLDFLADINGQLFVDLQGSPGPVKSTSQVDLRAIDLAVEDPPDELRGSELVQPPETDAMAPVPQPLSQNKKVFITHGKDREIVKQLKELLTFGDFEPVVSVDQESGAKPVSEKVLDDMRSCAAAIVHVGSEMKVMDPSGNELTMLNPNVLIEIGAAMALYGRKFILLVEKGVTLPSNLQGLYEVRYEGGLLDYDSTMKLLKAFNDFKN